MIEHCDTVPKESGCVCRIVGDLGHQVSSFSELQFYHLQNEEVRLFGVSLLLTSCVP